MPQDRRIPRGALGERIAADHLKRNGYRILARNFRTRYGELDLVAADERALVFCEVKTRVARGMSGPATPLEAIGPAKRRQLRRMAREWFADTHVPRPATRRARFDAIGVLLSAAGSVLAIEHVEDAFS